MSIVTTVYGKSHFTVVLSCCADDTKLPPVVIFKLKTTPKAEFPSSVAVTTKEKGWMDGGMMNIWLEKCYSKRPDGLKRAKPYS